MNILMLTDKMEAGGAETHIETLALALTARGHSVTVLSAGGAIADRLEAAGVKQIRRSAGRSPFRLLSLRRAIAREARRGQYDILHAHTRTMGVLLSLLHSCLHGSNRTAHPAHVVTVHAAKFGVPTDRMCKNASVIAVSEDLREGLLSHVCAPAECIHVIPNGIDTDRFSPPPPSLSPAPHSVLFASRLDPDCARVAELLPEVIPELLGQFPDLFVTVAGGGRMLESVREKADALNRRVGREVLRAVGAVDDMTALYRTHRVTVGVSRVALEAAACGCAVLLAGNEGYGGILRADDPTPALSNFCCRGAEPVTARLLCDDLARLLASPPPSLRDTVEKSFSAARMTDETEALYRSLLPPVSAKKPIRLLVGGYAGCGNLGDDAILQGLVVRLREEHPEVRLTALTGSPVRDTRRFGIPCVSRRWLPSVLLAMLRADIFLLGGGSLLQDRTGRRSLAYYLFLLRAARLLGCRTGTLAAGIGPLLSPRSERAVLRALRPCQILTLRDSESLRFLVLHGLERSRLELTEDPARFLPPPPATRCAAILARLGAPPEARFFCVAVRPTAPARHEPLRVLAAAVHRVAGEHGLIPIFPILDPAHDLRAAREVIRLSDCGGRLFLPDEPSDLPALLGGAALLVSMRLHALIFADTVGTPAIALSPSMEEPKLAVFARHAGFPHFSAQTMSVVALCSEMEGIIENKNKY
ncbi:MAG TPA: hypothetical protein DDW30_04115 [Clostridiales bacterium]|nr:hypothetical protein [Clostridiales bacterium]